MDKLEEARARFRQLRKDREAHPPVLDRSVCYVCKKFIRKGEGVILPLDSLGRTLARHESCYAGSHRWIKHRKTSSYYALFDSDFKPSESRKLPRALWEIIRAVREDDVELTKEEIHGKSRGIENNYRQDDRQDVGGRSRVSGERVPRGSRQVPEAGRRKRNKNRKAGAGPTSNRSKSKQKIKKGKGQ